MAGKKKAKSNKLARMSEEEKLRYLQHKAAIEEEARRRKQELISTFMKNKLKHEEAFTRLNSAKINQQWRLTLRQIKNNELLETTETLRQTFDIAIETKHKIIDTLLADLRDSVSMHDLAVQTHLEAIVKVIGIQEKRLKNVHYDYKKERHRKLHGADTEKSRVLENFSRGDKEIGIDMYWEKHFYTNNLHRMKEISANYRENYTYKILSKIRFEKEESERQIQEFRKEIEDTITSYEKNISPFFKHYKQLRDTDLNDMNINHMNIKKTRHLQGEIRKMKNKIQWKEKEDNDILSELKNLVNIKKNEFDAVRDKVKTETLTQKKSIKHLSTLSSHTIKYLENFLEKINTIACFERKCLKFYTEKESYVSLMVVHKETLTQHKENEELIPTVTKHFWNMLSKLTMETALLSAHHSSYMKENENLKHSLLQYMNTISKPSTLASCISRDENLR